jgi:hypothetical protein
MCGFSADQYLNCVTQFTRNIVWRVGTFPFLLVSKCRRKTHCITVEESLFLKNVSTANAQCSSNQRCMMTEVFKPLYPAMCVSLYHLQRCRHGTKFKSSNCFCPTLYLNTAEFLESSTHRIRQVADYQMFQIIRQHLHFTATHWNMCTVSYFYLILKRLNFSIMTGLLFLQNTLL